MAKKNLKFEINPLLGGPSMEARTKSGSPYRLLPISEIDVDPEQPRRIFNDEALAELAASIKEHGVISPILVRVTAGGSYRVVAGERRFRACKLLGLDSIPAVIDSDEQAQSSPLAKQLVENLQRADLTPMERALAIGQLRDKFSWSIREIARRLGTSKGLVQRSLEILELPEDLQKALINGASETKVLLLKQIENRETRQELLSQLESMSRAELSAYINGTDGDSVSSGLYHGGTTGQKSKRKNKELTAPDRRIVENIQRTLGTKVDLARSVKKPEQGKLILEFYSNEDLGEIYRRLT